MNVRLPSQKSFVAPTFEALKRLGDSGHNHEIYDEVFKAMCLSNEQLAIPHKRAKSMAAHRVQFALDRLKRHQLATNPERGFWILTPKGKAQISINQDEVSEVVPHVNLSQNRVEHEADRTVENRLTHEDEQSDSGDSDAFDPISTDVHEDEVWKDCLYDILLGIEPAAFERLFQLILRESGFTQVEVTGRSGDGGIDGIGVMRIGGFLSFKVLFQCKRYKGSIGASVIRDFRGAMVGRTDKGLIVTTGSFTPAATREATRDGAPEIDLVDGEQLIDRLAELELGVAKEMVPTYTIEPDFFAKI